MVTEARVAACHSLTFATVFVVVADPVAVADGGWQVAVEEGGEAVGQGPVVHVVQLAVVVGPRDRGPQVEERPAQELGLGAAGSAACRYAIGL